MTIEVDYTAEPGVESVDCVVTLVYSACGTLLTLWRSLREAQPGRPQAGKGSFRLEVGELPLLSGHYGLTIALHSPEDPEEQYDVLYKLFGFTIEPECDWDTIAPVYLNSSAE